MKTGLVEPLTAMSHTIHLTDTRDEATWRAIVDRLIAFNRVQAGRYDYRLLVLSLTDADEQVVGGLWGRTAYDWLFVELLFVPESLRGTGVGTDLMTRAENEAIARGCRGAWLDTFSFQAPGFYERLGYTRFGELADYPSGSSRYFFKKTLTPP